MAKKENQGIVFSSAFSLFRPSFDAVLVNVWTFLALVLMPIAGFVLLETGADALAEADISPTASISLITLFVFATLSALIISPALPYVQLMSVKGKQVTIGTAVRAGLSKFWRFYGLTILTGLIILVGFVLFIVPGLFMLKRYILAPFYLYDHNIGVLEAMKRSSEDAKRFSGAVWGLIGVIMLIGLSSIVPFFFFVTAALQVAYYCAPAVRYIQIKQAGK